MSELVKNLQEIAQSPFVLGGLYPAFYEALGPKKNSVLLAYLVVPLVFGEKSRAFINGSKSTSTLFTFAQKRDRIYGLARVTEYYKPAANLALQYGVNRKWLDIDQELSVKATVAVKDIDPQRPTDYKICRKLAIVLAPYDVALIYRTLGVRYL
jgi:Family of unknown function (DUF6521)